jgi:hypothetical protein
MYDQQLRQILRHWRDIDPPGDFEANVRHRIRLAEPARWQGWFLWRPAFATAAIAFSIAIGAAGGAISSPKHSEMQFMSAGTLAGNYMGVQR